LNWLPSVDCGEFGVAMGNLGAALRRKFRSDSLDTSAMVVPTATSKPHPDGEQTAQACAMACSRQLRKSQITGCQTGSWRRASFSCFVVTGVRSR
jgi:hypothetical protein